MSGGREFQRRGAERLKALDPLVDRHAGGTVRLMEEADPQLLIRRRAERYGGARLWMALNVKRRILMLIWCLMGSQWSWCRTGVM